MSINIKEIDVDVILTLFWVGFWIFVAMMIFSFVMTIGFTIIGVIFQGIAALFGYILSLFGWKRD